MAYNPNTYTSKFTSPKPAGQVALVQEVTTPSYLEDSHVVRGKEIRGTQHVEYRGLLAEDTLYDGIMTSRREKNMLVVVEKNDDGSPNGNIYRLKNYPGNVYNNISADWEKVTGGTTITLNNPIVVPDLTARDALTPLANDFVNASDAREYGLITGVTAATPAVVTLSAGSSLQNDDVITIKDPTVGNPNNSGIPDGDYVVKNVQGGGQVFELYQSDGTTPVGGITYGSDGHIFIGALQSGSFVYDGSQWLKVLGAGSIDPAEVAANTASRHNPNTDSQLLRTGGAPLSADMIYAHMIDTSKHFTINDANVNGATNEVWSSEYTRIKFEETVTAAETYTYSTSEIDQKIIASSLGIEEVYATIAARNADNTVTAGTTALVDEDRAVYRFTGVAGQSGAAFWDFRYFIDKVLPTGTPWTAPSDVIAPSQSLVAERLFLLNAGAYRIVANTAARDAITPIDRLWGMIVFVADIGVEFRLTENFVDGDIGNNANFNEISSGVAAWDSTKPYKIGNLTFVGTTLYLALAPTTDVNPTAETGDWTVIGFSNDLAEGNMWQGDANGKAASIPTDQQYIDNVGNIVLTQGYLYENYPTANLGQIVESTFQKATLEQGEWSIVKKHPKYVLQQIMDLSNADYWNPATGTLDVSDFIGADIINFKTTIPTSLAVGTVILTGTDPVQIGVSDTDAQLLKNGDTVRFGSVGGTVELNYDTNGSLDFTIANIDYTSGAAIFELEGTDSTNFTAYTSGGEFTDPSGVFEPIIDKIVGLPSKWTMSFAAHANENPTLKHYDESVATTNQLVSNTNNDVIIRGSDTLREMVTLSRNDGINVLYLPFSQNVKEQNLSSHLEELTWAGPTETFNLQKARRFFVTLTGNVDVEFDLLDLNTSVVFTADIEGAFSLDFPGATILGTYDTAVVNRCTFDLYRKLDGTQKVYVTIENIP